MHAGHMRRDELCTAFLIQKRAISWLAVAAVTHWLAGPVAPSRNNALTTATRIGGCEPQLCCWWKGFGMESSAVVLLLLEQLLLLCGPGQWRSGAWVCFLTTVNGVCMP